MDRRSFTLGLGAAAASLPFHARAQQAEAELHAAARREGELVLYTGTLVEVIEDLRKAFEAKYPGVRTQYWRGDTPQVTQRFETEFAANRHTADILLLTDRQSKILHARGMTRRNIGAVLRQPCALHRAHVIAAPFEAAAEPCIGVEHRQYQVAQQETGEQARGTVPLRLDGAQIANAQAVDCGREHHLRR